MWGGVGELSLLNSLKCLRDTQERCVEGGWMCGWSSRSLWAPVWQLRPERGAPVSEKTRARTEPGGPPSWPKGKRRQQESLRSSPQRKKSQEGVVSQVPKKNAPRGHAPQQTGSQEWERFETCSLAWASKSHGGCFPLGVKVCEWGWLARQHGVEGLTVWVWDSMKG